MVRRASRDPRTMMELRRLAARAQRDDDYKDVLADALLETFPSEFGEAIRNADSLNKSKHHNQPHYLVWFFPNRMNTSRHPDDPMGYGRPYRHLFEVFPVRKRGELHRLLWLRNMNVKLSDRRVQDDIRTGVTVYDALETAVRRAWR